MDAADQMQLDVSIEDAGPSAKKMTISIPSDAVDEKIETSFGTLQTQAQMRGFRKGRAPRALLEKRFGGDLMKEARGQLIGAAYQQALKDHELKTIGDPDFPEDLAEQALERGKPFTFTVTVEVVPQFDLPSLEGVAVTKPIFEIEDEHVGAELTRLKYRLGTPERITGPFEPMDRMVGAATVTVDGQEGTFFENDQVLAVVPAKEDDGAGPLLGLMIDNLGELLLGKSTGDTIDVETIGPPAHEREEVRGKKVAIHFTIKEAERLTPLEPMQLAEQFGLEDVKMLEERVKLELETRRDTEQRAAEREQVYEYLLEKTTVELPERISEAQVTRTIDRQRMEMLYRGEEAEAVEKRLAQIRGQTEEQALSRLKLLFIMDSIARKFEIQVTEAEINGRIAAIARQRGERPDQVRTELTRSGAIQEVARQILEHKAADRIVDQAQVTEMPADKWNEQAQAKTRGGGAAKTAASKKTTKKSTTKKTSKKKKTKKKTQASS